MRQFIARHASKISGVLSGFDRVVFRGQLLNLCHAEGVKQFFRSQKILLKDFGKFVEATTGVLRSTAIEAVNRLGLPVRYIESSRVRKEDVARAIAEERKIETGPICVLSALEGCSTWKILRSKQEQTQEPKRIPGKCVHNYHYFQHEQLGFMHVREQTWMPYMVQICVNGREWLARALELNGHGFVRAGNCFLSLANPTAAQEIFNGMLDLPWAKILNAVTFEANPFLQTIQEMTGAPLHWTIHQSEWATDVMFKDPQQLVALYPSLTRHAISNFESPNVMRFLGKRLVPQFKGEVVSNWTRRPEGVCVRHAAGKNAIKMYDKRAALLRVETTIQKPADFKRKRRAQGKPESPSIPRPMRKGIADIKPRAAVSQAANARYLDALSVIDLDKTVHQVLGDVLAPAELAGKRVRPLHPWSDPDLSLLRAISHGEFILSGFRNRDVRALLQPKLPDDPVERARQRARITRQIRMLRAHRLVEKVKRTHRYRVTQKGQAVIAAVLATNDASVSKLKQCA